MTDQLIILKIKILNQQNNIEYIFASKYCSIIIQIKRYFQLMKQALKNYLNPRNGLVKILIYLNKLRKIITVIIP